jgi:hypothetical protein
VPRRRAAQRGGRQPECRGMRVGSPPHQLTGSVKVKVDPWPRSL